MSLKRWLGFLVLAFLVMYLGVWLLEPQPFYKYSPKQLPKVFSPYYKFKRNNSIKVFNAIKGTEEHLIRYSKKSNLVFLYIHGFGANRQEGQYFVEQLSIQYKANSYFLRLPGHGTNKEDHLKASFQMYIQEAEEVLQMVQQLGKNVVVIATSMGANIATYLASKYSNTKIKGLILMSPFYGFADKTTMIFNFPGGFTLAQMIEGKLRNTLFDDESKLLDETYNKFLYKQQYTASLRQLYNLKKFTSHPKIYSKVKVPVLLFYYYRDEENQDKAASVDDMKHAFSYFENPYSTIVQVEKGNHVLGSKYIASDKKLMLKKSIVFLDILENTLKRKLNILKQYQKKNRK